MPVRRRIHSVVSDPRFGILAPGLVLLVLLGLGFGLMIRAALLEEPHRFDRSILEWVIRHRGEWAWLTHFFVGITRFGNAEVAVPATIVVAFLLRMLHRRGLKGLREREAVIWLAVLLGGWLLSRWLKGIFRRERPPALNHLVVETSFSFPSTHSVFSAIFFTSLALLLVDLIPPTRPILRRLSAGSCLVLALAVGMSRVWLGVHYPTDVIGGFFLGVGLVLLVGFVRHAWRHRRGPPTRGA